MRPAISKLLTVGVVAMVAVFGSIGGRLAWNAVTAEEEQVPQPPPLDVLNGEAAKAKFEGEILGVFLGPYGAEVPDKFTTYGELCGDEQTVEVDDAKAGDLDLAISLPEPFKLDTESMNTGVIACGDTVYAARWEYSAPQPSGYPGSMVIVRSLFKYTGVDASTGRIHTGQIGGLPAIIVDPLSEDGIGSAASVIIPGESGITQIGSSGVPAKDLLEVAELVAAAIKDRS